MRSPYFLVGGGGGGMYGKPLYFLGQENIQEGSRGKE